MLKNWGGQKGVGHVPVKLSLELKMFGSRKLSSDQSSVRLFCRGVPVRMTRCCDCARTVRDEVRDDTEQRSWKKIGKMSKDRENSESDSARAPAANGERRTHEVVLQGVPVRMRCWDCARAEVKKEKKRKKSTRTRHRTRQRELQETAADKKGCTT